MSLKHYASHSTPDASRTTSPGAWAYMSAATAARQGKLPPAAGPGPGPGPGAAIAVANMRKVLAQNGTQTKADVTAAERGTAGRNMRALIGQSDAACRTFELKLSGRRLSR